MRTHPCTASRLPLKATMLADRQSRIGGILGSEIARREALAGQARLVGGHVTGTLRVQAVSLRNVAPFNRGSLP